MTRYQASGKQTNKNEINKMFGSSVRVTSHAADETQATTGIIVNMLTLASSSEATEGTLPYMCDSEVLGMSRITVSSSMHPCLMFLSYARERSTTGQATPTGFLEAVPGGWARGSHLGVGRLSFGLASAACLFGNAGESI